VPKAYRRRSWRRPLTVLTVIAVLLAVGGYAAYKAYQHYVVQLLTVPGCQAGAGNNAIPLDFGQTADAATIAGVAVRQGLPRQALAIAYATALQEAKLENPSNGDLDSVGIFQQRPSEGWGSATQLQDPAYAATAFFNALVKVPNYTTLPVYQAAQDVQRSADGYAYEQYAQTGAALAAYFTATPHAVTCWYNPATQASDLGVSAKLDLKGAGNGLTDATPMHVIIVIQIDGETVGLLADRVLDIIAVDASQIQPVPKVSHDPRTGFLSGLVAIETTMIALIDLKSLLAS